MRRSRWPTAIALILLASACAGTERGRPTGAERTDQAPEAPPPRDGPPFVPETYREGGLVVMPITFPDGSTAEMVYPPQLALEGLTVAPDAYARLDRPSSCGLDLTISRSNLRGEQWRGHALTAYEGADGGLVGLWPPTKSAEPHHWLAYRFGDWNVLTSCADQPNGVPRAPDVQALWARSLDGRQTASGWLILDPESPLRLAFERSIRFSSRDVVVEVNLGHYRDFEDRNPGVENVVQWSEERGRIRVYAAAFTDREKGFLADVAANLDIRRVRGR